MDRASEPLDGAAIALPGVVVRIVERCTSTNEVLLKQPGAEPVLLAAEEQTAGRGRRGRRWHSAPGAGLTFSLGRRIRRPARELAALSLVAGVAAARALRVLGVREAALKWPNDLVIGRAKLGGILVEARTPGGSEGSYAVIGLGINCRRTRGLAAKLGRDIAFVGDYIAVSRNEILQGMASALLAALDAFEAGGLDALRAEWEAMDAHAGQRLRVRLADGRVMTGLAGGLAEDGALRLVTRKGVQAVRSGRVVSARAQ
jgi:BirA family transcriptional regulator, biotin operon repressor / biotin---[acetyl-CoA-carboxylase] ligase